jgi:hypothetical protein
MSPMPRGSSLAALAALLAPLLVHATAAADPPRPPPPKPPPAPPASKPHAGPKHAAPKDAAPKHAAPRHAHNRKADKEPGLPEPAVHLRILARSAEGLWTMRIENDGPSPVRVPADARLLELSVEDGNTFAKRRARPVKCKLPATFRGAGFPEPRALLLAPGEAYVEKFDPRLFCFGKDAKALVGGALVHARLGWDTPRWAKVLKPPFVVESTEMPSTVLPLKELHAPAIVLSYGPPEPEEPTDGDPHADKGNEPKADKPEEKSAADSPEHPDPKDGRDEHKPAPVVDEHAPRIELTGSAYVDSETGFRVAITVKATNAGHRPTLVAARSRMVGFRIDGPDGPLSCGAVSGETRAISRDGFRLMAPKSSTSLTVLVEEACGRPIFKRPGLYRVTPSLHLTETGSELGIAAYTGVARAKEPTLVRVWRAHDPYHPSPPRAVVMPKPDADAQ